jgi:hypothetical protein
MELCKNNERHGMENKLLSLCHWVRHGLTQDWTQTPEVRSQGLTTWDMARRIIYRKIKKIPWPHRGFKPATLRCVAYYLIHYATACPL